MTPIRVLIVDDDAIVRSALASYVSASPELDLVGTVGDGAEVPGAPAADVVLMDVQMPKVNGIDATKTLLARGTGAKVLMLTSFDTDTFLVDALQAGASGFMLKATTPEALVDAIRSVHLGSTVMSPESTATLLGRRPAPAAADRPEVALSGREREILVALCAGSSNAEIAEELFLSESTVKTYVSAIMTKLGVNSRLKIVVKAHEWGLLEAGS